MSHAPHTPLKNRFKERLAPHLGLAVDSGANKGFSNADVFQQQQQPQPPRNPPPPLRVQEILHAPGPHMVYEPYEMQHPAMRETLGMPGFQMGY